MPKFSLMTVKELSTFMNNFKTIANANLSALDYDAADITNINASKTKLDTAITAAAAARTASIAATAALKIARREAQMNISGPKLKATRTGVKP